MPFAHFHQYFPEVAKRETRSITVPPGSEFGLPPDDYGFLEMYCGEPGCDCRRVLFYVVARSRTGVQAVIGWGWEDVDFYTRWMKRGDRNDATQMKGPALNPLSPATELAPALGEVVRNVLLKDPEYVEWIKRHYRISRERINRLARLMGSRLRRGR